MKAFKMKPSLVVDEMFPEGTALYIEPGGSNKVLVELLTDEKTVHAEFFNDFDDLFDDEDLE